MMCIVECKKLYAALAVQGCLSRAWFDATNGPHGPKCGPSSRNNALVEHGSLPKQRRLFPDADPYILHRKHVVRA